LNKSVKRRVVTAVGAVVIFAGDVLTHAHVLAAEKGHVLSFWEWSDVVLQGLLLVAVLDVLVHLWIFDVNFGEAFESIRDHFPAEKAERTMSDLHEGLRMLRSSLPIRIFGLQRAEPQFQARLQTLTAEFQNDLQRLSEGYYEEPLNNEISNISIDIYSELKSSAFCTALQQHLNIFIDLKRSSELVSANDAAGERLYKLYNARMITRLFILEGWAAVPKYLQLLRQQYDKFVDVRVIFTDQVRDAGIYDEELDFGIWDENLVMKITGPRGAPRLVVSTRKTELERANFIRSTLDARSMDWATFNRRLREPMNQNWGDFATEGRMLRLPPPNGPGEHDVNVMFSEAKKALPSRGGNLGILGLTAPLISKALELKKDSNPDLYIEVVDIRSDPAESNGVEFTSANWLVWEPEKQFDAVIGDDILCNLRLWQFPLLFERLDSALKPDGLFIVRTTINPGSVVNIDPNLMVELLRDKREPLENLWAGPDASTPERKSERETAAYELAWPLLHNRTFYDQGVPNGFDLGAWNRWIEHEFRNSPLDSAFRLHLNLKYGVEITSASTAYLRERAAAYHFEALEKDVQSIWASDPRYQAIDPSGEIATRFKEHYKIFIFRKISGRQKH
jgi:hypothetical protein